MSRSRFATPLMLSLTAVGAFGLAAAQAGIVDLPSGYGLVEDAPAKSQDDGKKAEHEHRCGARHAEHAERMKDSKEGMCGADHPEHLQHMKDGHEGSCGAGHHAPAEAAAAETAKDDQEGKCGEGKCGEGKCGGMI
ncbi:MAG TPA: hypothetical protein PLI44_10030 [Chiayiivirga sp.]|jgi:uncharacterized low-complexity protein|uniref:Low-complexity protein n=1 Tax=Denitratimonas tolerans TaxID=1338420 RepID=A0AAW9R2C1_9GAMM|nr:hypothetical protein [Chiayiivirga sp.]HRN60557.1 hypothetical protein [Chiayiivirga sp.]HRO86588.1 hypothetical protein [Chiayiivirga sp.]HRQ35931.1 hypothetical protein [Chiayiivirga sp.]